MKVLAAILANPRTFGPVDPPLTGVARVIFDGLRSLKDATGDSPFPEGLEGVDQVQTVTAFPEDISGKYQITFVLESGLTFTTGDLNITAGASAIPIAMDRAATCVVPGYAAGYIAMTGGPLATDTLTLTFSGPSVGFASHEPVVVAGEDFTAGDALGEVQVLQEGAEREKAANEVQLVGKFQGAFTSDNYNLTFDLVGPLPIASCRRESTKPPIRRCRKMSASRRSSRQCNPSRAVISYRNSTHRHQSSVRCTGRRVPSLRPCGARTPRLADLGRPRCGSQSTGRKRPRHFGDLEQATRPVAREEPTLYLR